MPMNKSKRRKNMSRTNENQAVQSTQARTPVPSTPLNVPVPLLHNQLNGQQLAMPQIGIGFQFHHQVLPPSTSFGELQPLHDAAQQGFADVKKLSYKGKTELNTSDNNLMAWMFELEQKKIELESMLHSLTVSGSHTCVARENQDAAVMSVGGVENLESATKVDLETALGNNIPNTDLASGNPEATCAVAGVKNVETLAIAAISDHLATIEGGINNLKIFSTDIATSKENLNNIHTICEIIQSHMNKLMTFQKSLEQMVQQLKSDGVIEKQRISDLQGQLNEQKNKVVTITEQINSYQIELETSKCLNSTLVDEVKQLKEKITTLEETEKCWQDKVTNLSIRVSQLDAEAAVSEEDKALLVLRQLLSQVTTLMYKQIFPKKFKPQRTFTYADLQAVLKKLEKDSKKDSSLKAEYDQKLKETNELIKDLEWEDDMEDQIIKIKKSSAANSKAHPSLDSLDFIHRHILVLKNNDVLIDDEVDSSMKLAAMWDKLQQPQP